MWFQRELGPCASGSTDFSPPLVFPKCFVKGLSKHGGPFKLVSWVFWKLPPGSPGANSTALWNSVENWLQGALTQVLRECLSTLLRGGGGGEDKRRAPLDTKVIFLFPLQVWTWPLPGVFYCYIYCYWGRTRFRLNTGLQMVFRRWSHLQSHVLCMAVSRSMPLQLNSVLSDACSWKCSMAFHSSYKGKDHFLQSLWHDFCLHQASPCHWEMAL